MDGYDRNDGGQDRPQQGDSRDEIYSKVIRAGKRTYFFDIKATRANDFYLTITESKKRYNRDGRFFYEKHKLFLYKEDFDKFTGALDEVLEKIAELREEHGDPQPREDRHQDTPAPAAEAAPPANQEAVNEDNNASADSTFTEVSFDDLGAE